MVRPCSDPRYLNAQVRENFTAQHVKMHLPAGVPAMKVPSAMVAGSSGGMPWLVTWCTLLFRSHLHMTEWRKFWNFLLKLRKCDQTSHQSWLSEVKRSQQHSDMMRQVKWFLQGNHNNNLDYTSQPLPSILSLVYLKSPFHSVTLDSQYFTFLDRCVKWKIQGSMYFHSRK